MSWTSQEYNADCDGEKLERVGWMFRGCFAGPEKGPCLFLEKDSTYDGRNEPKAISTDYAANSPDLNQIEAVWNMKDYIQRHHPNLNVGKQRTSDSLRNIVKEAWDSVYPEDLVRLIESVPAICQAVIDADAGPNRY
ncbi:hypothetical protein BGHDH14_bgh05137 [Blumeria hordei DH14]|uniref:Tc1-like transposase DDE domain-containing protein n=1 Tax=Blumeria graminis f. sp. hordei (strain DH14) TaxID=546991 RepID=N1JGK9_BLUG1|nr:hypothetical protein BGHDH14_bgh05137 [Blumeria hordei DH14]